MSSDKPNVIQIIVRDKKTKKWVRYEGIQPPETPISSVMLDGIKAYRNKADAIIDAMKIMAKTAIAFKNYDQENIYFYTRDGDLDLDQGSNWDRGAKPADRGQETA